MLGKKLWQWIGPFFFQLASLLSCSLLYLVRRTYYFFLRRTYYFLNLNKLSLILIILFILYSLIYFYLYFLKLSDFLPRSSACIVSDRLPTPPNDIYRPTLSCFLLTLSAGPEVFRIDWCSRVWAWQCINSYH